MGSSDFPTYFKSEFGNKEFMIWATVSSCLVFADCTFFEAEDGYQSDFVTDHMVMSMCRVISCVGLGLKSAVCWWWWCSYLWQPHSLPCSSIHGILQERILEWIAISFFRGSSQSRNWTQVSCTAGAMREACCILLTSVKTLPCCWYSKVKLAHYSRYLLTAYFCIPVPFDEKDIFLLTLSDSWPQ